MKKVVFKELEVTFENNRATIIGRVANIENFSEDELKDIIKGILKEITKTDGLEDVFINGDSIGGHSKVAGS